MIGLGENLAGCLGYRLLHGPDSAALKSLCVDNLAEGGYLHAGGGEPRHVIRRRDVLGVHETVRAVEEAVHELEHDGVVVHLFKEVLDVVWVVVELVGADTLHVLLVVAALFKNEPAEVLG